MMIRQESLLLILTIVCLVCIGCTADRTTQLQSSARGGAPAGDGIGSDSNVDAAGTQPNQLQVPRSCCGRDGACSVGTDPAACNGQYVYGQSCDQGACDSYQLPRGACCSPDNGDCIDDIGQQECATAFGRANVTSAWYAGLACNNPDAQCRTPPVDGNPLGACCVNSMKTGTAMCSSTTDAQCWSHNTVNAQYENWFEGVKCDDPSVACNFKKRGACCQYRDNFKTYMCYKWQTQEACTVTGVNGKPGVWKKGKGCAACKKVKKPGTSG